MNNLKRSVWQAGDNGAMGAISLNAQNIDLPFFGNDNTHRLQYQDQGE